jgi:hypothetical protein
MSTAPSTLYRPPQWQTQQPAKVIITFPGTGKAPQYSSSAAESGASLPSGQTLYAFDAELNVEHEQRATMTRHAVQTGASISDHIFIEPAHLSMDIGMSDAMDSYAPTGGTSRWSGAGSKSISAYQTLIAMQFARVPLQITTRLRTYKNMFILNDIARDTHKTITGLRARIEFGQIFMAEVTSTPDSARPHETQKTNLGAKNPVPVSDAQQSQNNVTDSKTPPIPPSSSIGAGNWSSSDWNTQALGASPFKANPFGGK